MYACSRHTPHICISPSRPVFFGNGERVNPKQGNVPISEKLTIEILLEMGCM